jgi:hypothetical protein
MPRLITLVDTIAVLFLSVQLSGCVASAPTKSDETAVSSSPAATVPLLQARLVPQRNDVTRLYIYRPQRLLGAFAKPVVIVNDYWFGRADQSTYSPLRPGAVFVIDSQAPIQRAWLYQSGSEDREHQLTLPADSGRTHYLRLHMHPTYVSLEEVDTQTAVAEINQLQLSGYFDLPAAPPEHVLIDHSHPAYTVLLGFSTSQLADITAKLNAAGTNTADINIIDWSAFRTNPQDQLAGRIQHDDYPDSDTISGVLELVRRFPGTAIGLTWNGGIAITRNDYRHAEQSYQQYQKDPTGYEQQRSRDPRRDPVYPDNHLRPLLGW